MTPKESNIKPRSKSHIDAAICRNNFMEALNIYCKGLKTYYRAGEKAVQWEPGAKHDRNTRSLSETRSLAKRLGLDIIITDGKKELWCQIDVRKPKTVQKMKRYKYFRTKAPENGVPDEKIVESFFKDQYVIAIYSHSITPREPYMIRVAPFAPLVELGYNTGYYFPKNKGRINTVHWYTAKTTWQEAFVPGKEEDNKFSSIRKDGMVQPNLLGEKISMCKLLKEILKKA